MEERYLFSPLQGQVGKTAQNANFIGHENFTEPAGRWSFLCGCLTAVHLKKKKKKTLRWTFSSLVADTDASFLTQNIFLMIHC